jgi:hypothetical protein
MPSYDVSLQLARRKVNQFDDVLALHHEALACQECEDAILVGLQAWRWIERAEEILLEGEDENIVAYSPEAHAELHREYTQWLAASDQLLRVGQRHVAAGFKLPRLAELQVAADRVRQWLATQAALEASPLTHDELLRRAHAGCGAPLSDDE